MCSIFIDLFFRLFDIIIFFLLLLLLGLILNKKYFSGVKREEEKNPGSKPSAKLAVSPSTR